MDGASPVAQLSKSLHRNAKCVATDTHAGRQWDTHEAAFGFNLESSNPLYIIIGGVSHYIFRYTVGQP